MRAFRRKCRTIDLLIANEASRRKRIELMRGIVAHHRGSYRIKASQSCLLLLLLKLLVVCGSYLGKSKRCLKSSICSTKMTAGHSSDLVYSLVLIQWCLVGNRIALEPLGLIAILILWPINSIVNNRVSRGTMLILKNWKLDFFLFLLILMVA